MKELKKDLILESAIKNFAINGYEASMDEIASDAKVSKGLLFFYYKSKENLIIDAAIKSVPLDVLNYIETKEYNDIHSILYDLGTRFLDSYKNQDLRNLFLYTISNKNKYPEIKEKLRELCFTNFDEIFSKIKNISNLDFSLAKKRSFFGSLLCYLIWWDDNEQDIENYVEDLVKGFLN